MSRRQVCPHDAHLSRQKSPKSVPRANLLARLERGEEDWGDVGRGNDALAQFEGALHPVAVHQADHLD